jgi:hypothetical protein
MHHGLNVDTTRTHHTLPQALLAVVAQYVLAATLLLEQETLTHAATLV